ncbi:MAG TPA: tetratricopeptide repeat protein, partial [Allocoleopsis sp.]
LNPPQASAANQSTTTTAVDPVQQEIKGYEQVLQREPNNQAALEGLVNARLKMNDAAGAIEPLEKLVQLHPERTDYATLLDKIRSLAATPATSP